MNCAQDQAVSSCGRVKVSVVVPCYQHERFVTKALESVASQTFRDFEVRVADDASEDGTCARLEAACGLFDPGRYFYEVRRNRLGPVGNLNDLIRAAQGDYIAVLNSDDAWDPDKLRAQVAYLDTHEECGACFTTARVVDAEGLELPGESALFRRVPVARSACLVDLFERGNFLCHSSVLIRRSVYAKVGLYNPAFRQLPDYEMWLRIVKTAGLHVIGAPQTIVRKVPGSSSSRTFPNRIRELSEYLAVYCELFRDMDAALFYEAFGAILPVDLAARTPDNVSAMSWYVLAYGSAVCKPAAEEAARQMIFRLWSDETVETRMSDLFGYGHEAFYRVMVREGFGSAYGHRITLDPHHLVQVLKMAFSGTFLGSVARRIRAMGRK